MEGGTNIIIIKTFSIMKKFTVCAAIAAVSAFVGFEFNSLVANNNSFKYKLIQSQAKALELADSVMSNNQLFDADGSDTMADYLHAAAKVDSLYKTQE